MKHYLADTIIQHCNDTGELQLDAMYYVYHRYQKARAQIDVNIGKQGNTNICQMNYHYNSCYSKECK